MSWNQALQDEATAAMEKFSGAYATAATSLQNGIQSGDEAQYEAQVQEVLRQWRKFTSDLRDKSAAATQNQGVMDELGAIVSEVGDQRRVLERLRSEATTRDDQADSLNPKVQPSPYVNILGLQRTFRSSTRTALFWIAVVLAVLAISVIGYLTYRIMTRGGGPAIGVGSAAAAAGGFGATT